MFEQPELVKSLILGGFGDLRIGIVGDVMVDRYIEGNCERISPEAPVPVVHFARSWSSLGGAANVARNLAALGAHTELFGVVGTDSGAEEIRANCQAQGMGTQSLLVDDRRPTTSKTRVLADGHQLLRVDDESAAPLGGAEAERLCSRFAEVSAERRLDAVILCDYAKGVCSPAVCRSVIGRCTQLSIPVYVDPKGSDYRKYEGARAIKPNRLEINQVALAQGWTPIEADEAACKLMNELSLEFVALTLGAEGMTLVHRSGQRAFPAIAQEVFDVSGAGDTLIAVLVAGLSGKLGLMDAALLSNLAAAEVVRHVGCVPVSTTALLSAVEHAESGFRGRKLYERAELQVLAESWRRANLKVAFANGCFDLLHAGHVKLLEDAAEFGDRLIVAINSDSSVRRLKGEGRPLMPSEHRIAVLSALECVNAVVVFEEDTPLELIQEVKPDFLIKGGDYSAATVVGSEFVSSYGGRVVIIPLLAQLSSSQFADALRKL